MGGSTGMDICNPCGYETEGFKEKSSRETRVLFVCEENKAHLHSTLKNLWCFPLKADRALQEFGFSLQALDLTIFKCMNSTANTEVM